MKKKLLPLAMLAGLAGAVGTAQAAHLNPEGLGQALIYPYFNTLNGQHTDVHLVNTTNQTKAVKIRFLEGQNSREVIDFHVYLSAYDHFSGVIFADPNGEGAIFKTSDTTCTQPAIPAAGVKFRNFAYLDDAGTNSLSRTREGYLEVIEMGVLGAENAAGVVIEQNGNTADGSFRPGRAVQHVNGVPRDCSVVRNAWNGGAWATDPTNGVTNVGAGGLYGFASVFNVAEGTSATYSAVAIADFNTEPGENLHMPAGDTAPSLADVFPESSIFSGELVLEDAYTNAIDAVSALFTRSSLHNDYITEDALSAETDWVVTFPTKRFYMEPVDLQGTPAVDVNRPERQPFTAAFTEDLACEHIAVTYYDREEGTVTVTVEDDFSPRPPTTVDGWNLCTEVNVISFNGSDVLGSGLRYGLNLDSGFDNGWASIDLTAAVPSGANPANYNPRAVVGDTNTHLGLPVTGFAVIKYTNGDVGGVLSNYVGVVEHKYNRATQ